MILPAITMSKRNLKRGRQLELALERLNRQIAWYFLKPEKQTQDDNDDQNVDKSKVRKPLRHPRQGRRF